MASSTILPALVAPLSSKSAPSVKIPRIIYGTAWKKDRTSILVYQALNAKFRGVDTAAQPKHYNEVQVGEGIAKMIAKGYMQRNELYLQTKFTPTSGQDPTNMPYSASQSLEDQIHTSIASSLEHFTFPGSGEPYIDCLVLHSPLSAIHETHRAWRVFESYVPSKIHSLGISNTTLSVLQSLVTSMSIKPSVVQNRFYPETRWDVPLRKYCREQGITFQTFWTLTGNPKLLKSHVVQDMARTLKGLGVQDEEAVALYALVLGLQGTSVLNGTTNEGRMQSDLEGLEAVGSLIEKSLKERWEGWLRDFKALIGEV